MGDLDISNVIRKLRKYSGYKTALLKDVDDGECYIIQDGIYEDEDGDIIVPIIHL